jgi:hypothetical protein
VRFEVNGQPDLAAPLLEISRPISGTTVRDPRTRIEGTAFDPQPNGSSVREVQYSLAIEGDAITYTAQGTTNFGAVVDLFPGINGITLWAIDNADNRSLCDASPFSTIRQSQQTICLWSVSFSTRARVRAWIPVQAPRARLASLRMPGTQAAPLSGMSLMRNSRACFC